MECQLCGRPRCAEPVCGHCRAQLTNGLSPVICALCRDLFGNDYAFVWVPNENLSQSMKDQRNQAPTSFIIFMRPKCPSCQEFTNETITSIRMSSHRSRFLA